VATRLWSVVFDTPSPASLATWWGEALDWPGHYDDEESWLEPDGDHPGVYLVFVPVNDPKVVKNRVHLDLSSTDEDAQRATVARLVAAGAKHADIGQGEVPWVVLTDPQGNEFCVLEPRDEYADRGPLAAVVVDALDPSALARFWVEASGWMLVREGPGFASLQAPDRRGPYLEFVGASQPHEVKNRLHLDVTPRRDDDQRAEVERLIRLGARRVDIGQSKAPPGEVTWEVLADPEGNEFCVLRPR